MGRMQAAMVVEITEINRTGIILDEEGIFGMERYGSSKGLTFRPNSESSTLIPLPDPSSHHTY
jgi:hypothetical protein